VTARGLVEFDRVWFAYRDDHWVLEDVSLALAPGERVALVGATGSGKTTLASLLEGFYRPQRGDLRVDGRSLSDWDLSVWRRRIGFVPQEVFLFSGTIASNLDLAAAGGGRAAAERAARALGCHEWIASLPRGYDTPVVERGATLSLGQRQLLALTRALVHDPEVLVLDEATSSVDPHTDRLLQDAMRRLTRDRTCLLIAHRLSTLQDVDRIVVLHHGRVRETGSHAELMARQGIYARLFELQRLGGDRPPAPPRRDAEAEDLSQVVDTRLDLA
jgi:ATP-binding cassette subfamily B protein